MKGLGPLHALFSVRWGSFGMLQRYRCLEMRRSPKEFLRRGALWPVLGRPVAGQAFLAASQSSPPQQSRRWPPPSSRTIPGRSCHSRRRGPAARLESAEGSLPGKELDSDDSMEWGEDVEHLRVFGSNGNGSTPRAEADVSIRSFVSALNGSRPRRHDEAGAELRPHVATLPSHDRSGDMDNIRLLSEVWRDLKHFARAIRQPQVSKDEERYRYEGLTRLKYKLERAVWSDVTGQYTLLFITVGLMALAGGAAYSSVTGEDIWEALWHAQLFVLDSGAVSNEKDAPARFVGYVLTIIGLLTVSVLVGIVNQTIEQQVASVTSQIIRVVETDHIVVLNWSPSAPKLVRELMLGNRDTENNLRNNTIVVMSQENQKQMVDACRIGIEQGDAKGDVLCIRGNPMVTSDLETVSACYARTIIILADNAGLKRPEECDARAISTMLALASLADESNMKLPRVVMEVHAADTVNLVRRTFGDVVYPILIGSIAAKITVQTILMPGISRVFKDLLSFDGSEFYFLPVPPRMVNLTWRTIREATGVAIPVGLQHPYGLELLPADSTVITEDDNLIVLQRSRASLELSTSALEKMKATADILSSFYDDIEEKAMEMMAQTSESRLALSVRPALNALFNTLDDDLYRLGNNRVKKGASETTGHIRGPVLLCGWRPGIGLVLKTLDRVMSFGSEVHMLSWVPVHERDACLTADGLDLDYISNIKLMHYEGSPGVSRDLRQLPLTNRGYTAVVLLANWESEERNLSDADAVRMKSILLLRDYLFQCMFDRSSHMNDAYWSTHFVTEVSGAGSVTKLPFSEFVEVGALDVLAISQVVFQPALHNLQMQLLNTGEGLLPIQLVRPPAPPHDISRRIHDDTDGASLLIGYKCDAEVFTNPDPTTLVTWEEYYELILLNRVRKNKDHQVRQYEISKKLRRRRARLKRALGPTELTSSFDSIESRRER